MEQKIIFRPLSHDDMELLQEWLNMDHVIKWYGSPPGSFEAVKKKYGRFIRVHDPMNAYIFEIEEKPAGYIQTYMIRDYPEYNRYVKGGINTAGIDLFIGNQDYVYKGYGREVLQLFLQQVVFSKFDADSCLVGTEPKNIAAVKTYEKVGFSWCRTVWFPDEEEPGYLMKLDREEFMAAGA